MVILAPLSKRFRRKEIPISEPAGNPWWYPAACTREWFATDKR